MVVQGFLRALGVDPAAVPVDADTQAALYRSVVADRRMLIVLDNAYDSSQVLPLLPGSRTATVLITSRNALTGLVATHDARPLTVDVLEPAEARQLLVRRLGSERINTEPAAVDQLFQYCAGLPLALSIIAARAATQPNLPLIALANDLREVTRRLNALDTGDANLNLRATFSLSYRALPTETTTLFALLGLAPGLDIGLPAATALAALPRARVTDMLRELETSHLVHQPAPGRYRMHDLIRLYATEQAHHLPHPDRAHAQRRLLDFYLHTAEMAADRVDPSRRREPPAITTVSRVGPPLRDRAEALSWFSQERANLVAAVDLALAGEHNAHAWLITRALWPFFVVLGYVPDWISTHRQALVAVRRLGQPRAEAEMLKNLGFAYWWSGDHDAAVTYHDQALLLDRQVEDRVGEAKTSSHLGFIHSRAGDQDLAIFQFRNALALYRDLRDEWGTNRALTGLGDAYRKMGRLADASSCLEEGLAGAKQCGDHLGDILARTGLGFTHVDAGQLEVAVAWFTDALARARRIGDRWPTSLVLSGLGYAHLASGNPDQALIHFTGAFELGKRVGDRWCESFARTGVELVRGVA